MPNIPTFNDQEVSVRPSEAAQVSPAAMAAPAEAVSRAASQVGDTMQAFNEKYANAQRAADAAHLTAQASETLGNLQHQFSLVPDRAQAQAGFDAAAVGARKQLLDNISDPFVQSHVAQSFDGEVISRRYDTANAAFRLESSTRRGQMDTDLNSLANGAAGATNDALRAKLTDNALASIKGAVAAGWMDPESGDKLAINFKSQVQEVQARKIMNAAIDSQDGTAAHNLATALSDPSAFPGLLPERREVLQTRLETLGYRLDQRAIAKVAHQDSVADRQLRQAQGHNEATILAAVDNGKPISDSDLQHLADTQQISAGGVEAIHAAKVRAENGIDDPSRTLQLWHGIGTKQVTSGDIFDALGKGEISRNTSVAMMRSLDAKATKQDDQVGRSAFNQVKTALHGGAIEQGLFKDNAPAEATWAQAQGEWARRVTVGGENPVSVRDDMLKRYGHNTTTPTWLDQPKLGIVQSYDDMQKVAKKTLQAHNSGQMSDADFRQQQQLFYQYKNFYPPPKPKPAAPGATP